MKSLNCTREVVIVQKLVVLKNIANATVQESVVHDSVNAKTAKTTKLF